MPRTPVKSFILLLVVSAAALSSCTRRDRQLLQYREGLEARSLEARTPATGIPDRATLDPQPGTRSTQQEAQPESTPSTAGDAGDVIDELDQALMELEQLLGSTEQWDIPLP